MRKDELHTIIEFCEKEGIPYTRNTKKLLHQFEDKLANQNANETPKTHKDLCG